jgi:hypothetical protein
MNAAVVLCVEEEEVALLGVFKRLRQLEKDTS